MMRDDNATKHLKKQINDKTLTIDKSFATSAMADIKNGADPNVTNDNDDTLFHLLANDKHNIEGIFDNEVKELAKVCDVNRPNKDGITGIQMLMKNTSSTDAAMRLILEIATDISSDTRLIKSDQLKIIETISTGSSGMIFKGSWNGNKIVAIKGLTFTFDTLIKCNREKNIMQKLSELKSPNIVGFFAYTVQKNSYFIVMEHAPCDLVDYLNSHHDLRWGERLKIMSGIAEGLYQMHKVNIVHRDIKPENILIGNDGVSKICDFGHARYINDATDIGSGTEGYKAPEVVRNDLNYNRKCADVYSFGLTMFEIFTDMNIKCYVDESKKSIYEVADNVKISGENKRKMTQLVKECCDEDPMKRLEIGGVVKRLM